MGTLTGCAVLCSKLLTPLIYLNNNYRIQLVLKIFDKKDKNSVPTGAANHIRFIHLHGPCFPTLGNDHLVINSCEFKRGQWPQPYLTCTDILRQVSC